MSLYQFLKEGGERLGCRTQICVLLQQHADELLGLGRGLVARRQLLEQSHFHLDHVFPPLRLQALKELVWISRTQPVYEARANKT